MSTNSNIEWTETTWNPMVGCTKVSPGCANCYAITESRRVLLRVGATAKSERGLATRDAYALAVTNNDKPPRWTGKVGLMEHKLGDPLRWREPLLVFVNSMSDLFHEDVPFEFIDKVFAVMALTPQHTYQVLTKRPARMAEYLNDFSQLSSERRHYAVEWLQYKHPAISVSQKTPLMILNRPWGNWELPWPLPNVWLGTSVENQATADERIPHLLRCPAAVRWLSCEPLLGPVDLTYAASYLIDPLPPRVNRSDYVQAARRLIMCGNIQWVVVGGESGKGARPMHPDWARSLRDQCQAAGVPFFFKQWGEWVGGTDFACDGDEDKFDADLRAELQNQNVVREVEVKDGCWHEWNPHESPDRDGINDPVSVRVGKKAAGRLLDGVEHNEYPEGTA